ncbi:MAG: periplasmic heavy metal sensor [Deltaproteobacteria bacterium]
MRDSWVRLLSGLVLLGVFAAGTLFGAGLMRWHPPGPPPPHGGPIDAMIHELSLDDAQITALHEIERAHRGELDQIAREAQPRVRAVLFAIEDELRPHLRAAQVQALERWRKTRPPAMPR